MNRASSVSATEFRFNAGSLALDLPATVRRRASRAHDVLVAPGSAARWLLEAGLMSAPLRLSPAQESGLVALREAVWRAANAVARHRPLPAAAIRVINRAAAHGLAVPRLDSRTRSVTLLAPDPFRSALAVIARDAIEVLSGSRPGVLKACGQPDCRMLFLDSSRSRRRRWCSMDRCGSRAKGAAFRQRHRHVSQADRN